MGLGRKAVVASSYSVCSGLQRNPEALNLRSLDFVNLKSSVSVCAQPDGRDGRFHTLVRERLQWAFQFRSAQT